MWLEQPHDTPEMSLILNNVDLLDGPVAGRLRPFDRFLWLLFLVLNNNLWGQFLHGRELFERKFLDCDDNMRSIGEKDEEKQRKGISAEVTHSNSLVRPRVMNRAQLSH